MACASSRAGLSWDGAFSLGARFPCLLLVLSIDRLRSYSRYSPYLPLAVFCPRFSPSVLALCAPLSCSANFLAARSAGANGLIAVFEGDSFGVGVIPLTMVLPPSPSLSALRACSVPWGFSFFRAPACCELILSTLFPGLRSVLCLALYGRHAGL